MRRSLTAAPKLKLTLRSRTAGALTASATALAFVDVENCFQESTCEGEAEATAEINGECDGELTNCTAVAIADTELDGCDSGNLCQAESESTATVEDCNGFNDGGNNGPDALAVTCSATAIGEASATNNSSAFAENTAIADAWGVEPVV